MEGFKFGKGLSKTLIKTGEELVISKGDRLVCVRLVADLCYLPISPPETVRG